MARRHRVVPMSLSILLLFGLSFRIVFRSLSVLYDPTEGAMRLPSAFSAYPATYHGGTVLGDLGPLVHFAVHPGAIVAETFGFQYRGF